MHTSITKQRRRKRVKKQGEEGGKKKGRRSLENVGKFYNKKQKKGAWGQGVGGEGVGRP
jgi:hypothetical protein